MGVFDEHKDELFITYRVGIDFRDKLMGGVPMNPKIIEGWLRSKMGVTDDDEVFILMRRTLEDLGAELPAEPTVDDLIAASEALADVKQTNGFKRDDDGLYIESRQVKAMLKEVTNILFAGTRWGPTRKSPKGFFAERVFPADDRLHLSRTEPDGVDLFIGHVSGPNGQQSTVTYYQYVQRASIEFDLLVTKDAEEVIAEHWPTMWLLAQENALGALRSQGFGRFDVVGWEKVGAKKGRKVKVA